METTKARPMSRLEIMGLIARDLQRVEKAIGTDTICSVEAVTEISHHLQKSGGKRLRPALLLLCAKACGYKGDSGIRRGVGIPACRVGIRADMHDHQAQARANDRPTPAGMRARQPERPRHEAASSFC
jgi:geranylgeranyl pyrophosphate synthase